MEGINYIHAIWGGPDNYAFYADAISNSEKDMKRIPQFFLLLCGQEIVGCFGLIMNDFISRHDLYPWLSSVYVSPEHRGQRLSGRIFEHAKAIVKTMGYEKLYLTTGHDGLYEKFGWQRIEDGYDLHGEASRIYQMVL
ncbi:GNAT family N-acetyltransferase [Photobacterium sp. 53610]|uniref:GNAT family N-acetyltransferase n=1 Tax=Photobacterium sp. 53610 TaxID=3102789 RepID=UPI002ED9D400